MLWHIIYTFCKFPEGHFHVVMGSVPERTYQSLTERDFSKVLAKSHGGGGGRGVAKTVAN